MKSIPPTSGTSEVGGYRRALCCQSGNLRYVSRRAQLIRFMPELPPVSPVIHYGRFTAPLACEVCGEESPHALLRDGDRPEARNIAERDDYRWV